MRSAWDTTTGSPGLVIADLDTGVRFDHPDLRSASANRLLPGYNMISNATVANDVHRARVRMPPIRATGCRPPI